MLYEYPLNSIAFILDSNVFVMGSCRFSMGSCGIIAGSQVGSTRLSKGMPMGCLWIIVGFLRCPYGPFQWIPIEFLLGSYGFLAGFPLDP